jgi:hypothetical protein
MTTLPRVYVYELTTQPNRATKASVGAACLAVLARHRDADLHVWTVAATPEQALNFQQLPWVIRPRPIGQMNRVGPELVYRYLLTGETWKLPTEAVER